MCRGLLACMGAPLGVCRGPQVCSSCSQPASLSAQLCPQRMRLLVDNLFFRTALENKVCMGAGRTRMIRDTRGPSILGRLGEIHSHGRELVASVVSAAASQG